jgi:hypothetical protein
MTLSQSKLLDEIKIKYLVREDQYFDCMRLNLILIELNFEPVEFILFLVLNMTLKVLISINHYV